MVNESEIRKLKCDGSALRLYASRVPLEKRGKEYSGKCPFHSDKTASFTVNQKSSGEWLYFCFGCSVSGDVIGFVQKMDNCTFQKAVETVKEFSGIQDFSQVDAVFKPLEEDTKQYRTFTMEQYAKLETALAESEAARAWLKTERGIDCETAKRLHIGYRQDVKELGRRFPHLANKGWIALPVIRGGEVVSIKYRSIVEKAFTRQMGMRTDLFNLDSVNAFEAVWVTEGEFDSSVLEQAGFRAISLPSASYVLTPEQRDILLDAEQIILAGDADGAGVTAMDRLGVDFGKAATRIAWPEPYKDANETFLKECKGDTAAFKTLCDNLVANSKSQPMKSVYSLVDVMKRGEMGSLADHPNRFHFRSWPQMDKMANILPGDVVVLTATNTGMGKSQLVIQATLDAARLDNEVVVNYQCEMSADEAANIAAAQILAADRNNIGKEQYLKAAQILGSTRYYIGADPSLTDPQKVLDLIEAAVVRFGATVVVLDHIHFICRGDNEIQQQSAAMQRIKNMARKYGLKFFVVAQPRKSDQKSQGKEKHLDSIKGSEAVASDASVVLFLHRELVANIDPANPPADDYMPETDIRLKKVRSKGTGNAFVRMYFHGNIATFREMTNSQGVDNFMQNAYN